jgi:hypothetical protein
MDEPLRACIDRILPQNLADKARLANAREHGRERPSPFEAAVLTSKLWKPGRTLRIRFLDGVKAVHDKVADVAREWTRHANVTFDFGTHANADIRISFAQRGYWSALGTDALVDDFFPPSEPTMNFGGFTESTPDEEYSRVVLHEFGHALGCIHEHQNPAGGIQWNKPVVYRDLGGPPNRWSKETVDHNVFNTYDRTITQFTEFDDKSIMLYAFPRTWTLNGMTFPNNRTLSSVDKAFIAARYPKAT